MGEKERFEVLLEEIRRDIKIVAEGLVGLRQEMERRFEIVYQEISELKAAFKLYAKQADKRLTILETRIK